MLLANKGLTKLTEECGELIQIASKKINYMDTDEHPDGKGSLKERLENEIADVMAAAEIVSENFELDRKKMTQRANKKLELFKYWRDGGTDNEAPIKMPDQI